jgi:hypothetical protein
MKKLLIILIPCLWLIVACTPEPLDINIPQHASQPVVATQYYYDTITEQSVLAVTLSKTLSATTGNRPAIDSNGVTIDEDYLIAGARVELVTSRETIELTEETRGIYYAVNPEVLNHEFCTIRAYDNQGRLIIHAVTEVMPEMDFTTIGISSEGRDKYINYTLTDDPAKANWYVVNYFTKQQSDTAGNYNDPKYVARRLTEQNLRFDLFTDRDFKQGSLSVKRKLERLELDTVAAAVSNISQGYYQFLQTQKKYGLFINQVKGEVINFPTNITGGLGYFSLAKPKMKMLQVQ